mmetsp:Transcript_21945/g.65813  ORF Transcript_21945/g.65813 Transcript_21945/m.65813 type:complete len:393 (-) Transcript_21945:52-1230(-)
MRFARQLFSSMSAAAAKVSPVSGLPKGPYAVGVTTLQFEDPARADEDTGCRKLQTEIWYPAAADCGARANRYSDFLGAATPDVIQAAEGPKAIGGYADGTTIAALDASWPKDALRDARPLEGSAWPAVVFSHGSGAYRASYIYWTEFLASHGYVVAAADHPGSARFTLLDGAPVVPGGPRSERARMEADRVADVGTILDGLEKLAKTDSRFAGRLDAQNAAVTGMSFGGWTTAAYLEKGDPRVKAAVMKCPSINSSDGGRLAAGHASRTPALVMLGTEDTVIGEAGNEAGRAYVSGHAGPAALLEIKRGGHCSFTSCDLYTPTYGNGIGPSASLSAPGTTYEALDIAEQHAIANSYGLAFLNAHLKPGEASEFDAGFLAKNHFGDEIVWESF